MLGLVAGGMPYACAKHGLIPSCRLVCWASTRAAVAGLSPHRQYAGGAHVAASHQVHTRLAMGLAGTLFKRLQPHPLNGVNWVSVNPFRVALWGSASSTHLVKHVCPHQAGHGRMPATAWC